MKKYIILLISTVFFPVLFFSCEKYLDKSPESGMTTEDVFKKIDNLKKFFLSVYEGGSGSNYQIGDFSIRIGYPFYFNMVAGKETWEGMTDCADLGILRPSQTFKSGQFSMQTQRDAILNHMISAIRVCNMTLQNIHLLEADQTIIDDYTAQAYFVRAFAHFELFRVFGRMPYLNKVLTSEDKWDIPRLSKHETLLRIAADMDSAATFFAKAELMRRDNPVPGGAGHLSNANQAQPNGVAAKAYKARALLYAASPLNNELGVKDWEEAAKANWEAITIAKQYGYDLLTALKYKDNYIGVQYTNEQLWGYYVGTKSWNSQELSSILNGPFSGETGFFSGECPTQNFVDKFETKYGDPLNTQDDRDAATAIGHYNEQNPYQDRDPRFYIDIIYNQADNIIGWTNAKAQIYYEIKGGVAVYAELQNQSFEGITKTGYYSRKYWPGSSIKNQYNSVYTEPLIRLAELYLNYAEATNEAYGSNGSAPGASMTAIQAINLIRARIGQPDVLAKYTTTKDDFRTRIKNERNIELSFEGHYYHDIRRWKDAPVAYAGPLMGIDIEKVPVIATYPTGFKYTRFQLQSARQSSWKEPMYYFPFRVEDTNTMKEFVPNDIW